MFHNFFIFLICFTTISLLEAAAFFLLGKKWPVPALPIKSLQPVKSVTLFSKTFHFRMGTFFDFVKGFFKTFLATPLIFLWIAKPFYWPAYIFFFSALIITIFTDLEELVISRYVTLYLVPVGWALSMFKLLPISPTESILGSIFGLLLLYVVRAVSRKFLDKEGLGQGDIDLLAFIGAFLGPFGCWISVMAGSLLACLICIPYALITKQRHFMIPFGVFLALGSITFVLFQNQILAFFIPL